MVVCVTRSRKCGAVDCHLEYLSASWKLGVNRPFLLDRGIRYIYVGFQFHWESDLVVWYKAFLGSRKVTESGRSLLIDTELANLCSMVQFMLIK